MSQTQGKKFGFVTLAMITLGMLGFVSACVLVVQALLLSRENDIAASETSRMKSYRSVAQVQKKALNEYKWVDKQTQVARIPVKTTMKVVVEQIRKGNNVNLVPAVGEHSSKTVEPTAMGWTRAPKKPPPGAGARSGDEIYNTLCVACHTIDGSARVGPTFKGIYGTQSELTDGTMVTVDEAYMRESILEPAAKLRKGFPPSMTPFKGILSDEEIKNIIEYVKTVK